MTDIYHAADTQEKDHTLHFVLEHAQFKLNTLPNWQPVKLPQDTVMCSNLVTRHAAAFCTACTAGAKEVCQRYCTTMNYSHVQDAIKPN